MTTEVSAATSPDWDETVDVVVVGSGGGITGAYTAAREGLSVALVEGSDQFGGTTAYSGGGGMWFPCNPVLRRAGVDDTIDEALKYFHAVVGDRTPRALQDAYVRGGARLIEYLEADPEEGTFKFKVLPWPDYFGGAPGARLDGMRHIVSRALHADALGPYADRVRGPLDTERLGVPAPDLLTGGRALIGRFLAALRRFPDAAIHLESPLTDLVLEDGVVTGAVVQRHGEQVRIRARRGVLLAAGGFEQNAEMRRSFGVPGRVADTMGAPGNDGAAHRAAIGVGAATDLMDQAWWSPGLTHPDGRSTFSLWFTGGIFVDSGGRRFVNESGPYDRLGRTVVDQIAAGAVGLPFWMIYDDADGGVPPVKSASVSLVATERYRDAGLWHTADTLEDLAVIIGVPPAELQATVARFNELVAEGVDRDFGRGDEAYDRTFTGGASPLVAIDQPPFHAAAFGLSDLGTKGGLVTDADARVLDDDGRPIPGLYAAGNTMAAVSGTVYPGGGNPIGASMLFSHLAALHMAGRPAPR
ncbi:3-ketosteroid-delta-1-dehydrogenase [Mycobacterium antarcticum]|uniref:FAD-binding protein n=1 Tax=unclassified Mycolicibacterium TaxID=2636767 RepID=UPI00239CD4B1|nr:MULTISPECIES: FAD-binding protein [unclassified Mycolicibacterium]BDX31028.1 3-ketosteroid-delta-1-dehydrogenase [Mycolicibacterium sp. TUM20985]GLP74378.1 3-ketosteroid-delta-1-dehydrogenase [Mycolicibacterium sp. TUM20983]